jgi:hypothetical protein
MREIRQAIAEERLKDWAKSCYSLGNGEEEEGAPSADPWGSHSRRKSAGKKSQVGLIVK